MKNETVKKENVKFNIGLRFTDQSKAEILSVLGPQQTKVVESLFDTINKFKKTAVLTVLPDLLKQVHELVMRSRLSIIQENIAAEEAEDPQLESEDPQPKIAEVLKVSE